MMVIRGIYERHQVRSLNHGIGFDTAAIELLLPTYGESLGLRGKICEHWALNPHPTMIPAIESGLVKSIHCFGSEVGMDRYVAARPDIFFIGRDGSLRSNRVLCQLAGQYAVDGFVGSTLQMDADANSSTVTTGRLAGFGGAPNMGHDPHGRRHSTKAWLDLITEDKPIIRGRKLVVQTVETFQSGGVPAFVETLDAVHVGQQAAIYVSNRRARVLRDPDGIREDLITNIAYPVRWHDATRVAYERGVRFFLELPPGHTLSDLASIAFPDARSIALSQIQIDSAVKLIKRQAKKMR
jgi:malonate decarboxylase alpha subunit